MSAGFINVMLWTFSLMLVAVGIAQLVMMESSVGGWSAIAIGMALIVVAASTRKVAKDA